VSVLETLASVAAGWGLSELSQYLRRRSLRLTAIGKALAELLEIRHHLRAVEMVFAELRRRFPQVSAGDLLAGMNWIEQLLPPDPGLPRRYEEAVTELAGSEPLLAFQLRSKEQLPPVLVRLRALQLVDPNAVDLVFQTDEFLRSQGLVAIDDAIRDLAWHHGVLTWCSIRRLLSKKLELPTEFDKFVTRVQQSGLSTTAPPPPAPPT
jgi:hypothetical protein